MYGDKAVDWTDSAVATLKTMWAAGGSHSEIAAVIPNATRSAVAGKIMRLKLPPRVNGQSLPQRAIRIPRAAPSAPQPRPAQAPPRPVTAPRLAAESSPPRRRSFHENLTEKIAVADDERDLSPILKGEAPDGTGIKFSELRPNTCRWPRGDPAEDDFEFCGGKSLPDLPYCARHSRIAYAPPKARAAADKWALHRADTKS